MRPSTSRLGADHPDPAVTGVGDVEVARGVDGEPQWLQQRCGGGSAVATEALPSGAGHGADNAVDGELLHDVVIIGEEEVAAGVGDETGDPPERGLARGSAVGRQARLAGTGDGVDHAGGVDAADAAVVGDVDGPRPLVDGGAPDAL